MPLTLYTFGYWGWGNHTARLVKGVDAVERHRGYRPPLFVDIRIHRAVRAKGFAGNAFERTVGQRRYRWMPELGNRSVLPGQRSDRIRILLLLARAAAKDRRHVIFFCSCEQPRGCHRLTVARLVMKEARRRGVKLQVEEWPA